MAKISFQVTDEVLKYGKFAIVLIVFGIVVYWLSSRERKKEVDALGKEIARLKAEKIRKDKARRDALNAGKKVNRDITEK